MNLADQKCGPCTGGVPPMDRARADQMLTQLGVVLAVLKDIRLDLG